MVLLPGLHSPFIWSLVRPWLLWPALLNEHLSPDSHKTVIVHELAHLRRRDHWIGWLQLAGECIFWWNPLFWFVRRQIRFQAELACDAWVMHLLPEARRAYAEALIEVTALISRAPTPVPALGMSSAARQDFERRLTMIMSEKVPGKAPLIGLTAIGLLALAVLPAFSQNVQNPSAPVKTELNVNVSEQGGNPNQAKIDSLIVELDALVSTINAAHDEPSSQVTAPAQAAQGTAKLTSQEEMKLVEAIELAYSEALLLKEGDDNQSDQNTEARIKQIEKKLAELLKEVQGLKAGVPAKGTLRMVTPDKGNSAQSITIESDLKNFERATQSLRVTGQLKNAATPGQQGHVLQLMSPKDGQTFVIELDDKNLTLPQTRSAQGNCHRSDYGRRPGQTKS